MNARVLLTALALATLLPGCGERAADLSSPNSHRSAGIAFDYPGNWRVTEDTGAGSLHYMFVETPGDALVILQSYPDAEALPLVDFADAFSAEAAGATPIGTVSTTSFTARPDSAGFEWREEAFSIDILGETVPHYRLYGTRKIRDRRVFLIFQVADEDRAKAEPGFELIRDTLRDSTATTGP